MLRDPIDFSIERPSKLDRQSDRLRVAMISIAPHICRARDQLEVFQIYVALVAILEYQAMIERKRTVHRFPIDQVHGAPARLHRKAIMDLAFKVAIFGDAFRSDRLP